MSNCICNYSALHTVKCQTGIRFSSFSTVLASFVRSTGESIKTNWNIINTELKSCLIEANCLLYHLQLYLEGGGPTSWVISVDLCPFLGVIAVLACLITEKCEHVRLIITWIPPGNCAQFKTLHHSFEQTVIPSICVLWFSAMSCPSTLPMSVRKGFIPVNILFMRNLSQSNGRAAGLKFHKQWGCGWLRLPSETSHLIKTKWDKNQYKSLPMWWQRNSTSL